MLLQKDQREERRGNGSNALAYRSGLAMTVPVQSLCSRDFSGKTGTMKFTMKVGVHYGPLERDPAAFYAHIFSSIVKNQHPTAG